jgi:D-alanyl-D-alanine dipeptidase
MKTLLKRFIVLALVVSIPAQAMAFAARGVGRRAPGTHPPQSAAQAKSLLARPKPRPAPERWRGLIGEYGGDDQTLYILEKDGRLNYQPKGGKPTPLTEVSNDHFMVQGRIQGPGRHVRFTRDAGGRARDVSLGLVLYQRRQIEPEAGANQLRVTPLRPVPELLKEARAASPPEESGEFRQTELVELTKLDPTIKLEIRYATTNNLFGTVFYSEARAFLQRPAAESLVRVNRGLKEKGYGLLVHDAYRPWFVTRVFWDATPDDKKKFVADPAQGSRHNRGCAVDLTLYDLKTGKPVEMVSTYDETTDRASPGYPGGTSLQRWHRDLLRAAMESEGFKVFEGEWWHFDYKDWKLYRIGNVPFDQIGDGRRR